MSLEALDFDVLLHLWGRLDGERSHPDFGWAGTI